MSVRTYWRDGKRIQAIQWTGKNLRDVIRFTGKHPKWNEWFKSWSEYEECVRASGGLFKLFVPGGYAEVMPGDWIASEDGGKMSSYEDTFFLREFLAEEDSYKFACNEWLEKTKFVQQWMQSGKLPARYLGWHRADILQDLLKERDLPRPAKLLELAGACGATISGKPDGSEPVAVVFTPQAWRAFDAAVQRNNDDVIQTPYRVYVECADSVVEENREALLQRSNAGRVKYGVTLDKAELTGVQWCQHAIEELLDGANYLRALQRQLKEKQDEQEKP